MYLVGLTGGIGSGKSTVARLLADHGARIIDADEVAREIVEPGEPALAELADHFGPDILDSHGRLDRAELARRAFVDDATRARLNAITHPRVAARIAERIAQLGGDPEVDPADVIVVDHPLLIETGQAGRFDAVVVVLAEVERRVRRLTEERGLDEGDVRARVGAQASDAARRAAATHLIDNDHDRDHLRAQVDDLFTELLTQAREAATVRDFRRLGEDGRE
jgi:dephospho-CoA kinase